MLNQSWDGRSAREIRLLKDLQSRSDPRQRQMPRIEHTRQLFHQLQAHHQMLAEHPGHRPRPQLRLGQNLLRQALAKLLLLQCAVSPFRFFSLNQIDHKLRVDTLQRPSGAFQ